MIIEFLAVPGDELLGTVEFRADTIDAQPASLADVVRPVWVRLGMDPRATTAFFSDWSNGLLRSQPQPEDRKETP